MNTQELLQFLKAARKSVKTDIVEDCGSLHYHWPRKGWQRYSRVAIDRPVEEHVKALEWVEQHA